MIRRSLSGCALLLLAAACLLPAPAAAKPSEKPFEILPGSFHLTPSTTQAAAHEDLTTAFDFATTSSGPVVTTDNDARTTIVNYPPGFVGNNTAVPTCTLAQLIGVNSVAETYGNPECPPASQVGQIKFDFTLQGPAPDHVTLPLYNMQTTSFGLTAQLGFNVGAQVIQVLDVGVRPGDEGLTVTSPNLPLFGEPHNVSATVWGLPASHEHDAQRNLECFSSFPTPCVTNNVGSFGAPRPLPANIPVRPYLSNPTSCGPFTATMRSNSWEHPDQWSEAETEVGPITGCQGVPFTPEVKAVPTTDAAESASGLDFTMNVPQQWENPYSLSTANLRDATVTLPAGMSLNPSAGSGLGSCTEAQFAEEGSVFEPGRGCPPESKLGTVEVETPLLTEKAQGAIYVAKPIENPFHSLLALYVLARIPARGIIVKLAGQVHADPVTGQLTTTFRENPQVPFSAFHLRFRQGATSPLVTPPTCGTYTAQAELTPWSAPEEPLPLATSFPVETGTGGGPCPSAATPPFHPGLLAGSIDNAAGHYSPFYLRLSRSDGEQEITHFSIKLPPGVIGKLAGIPLCTDAEIAQALSRSHEGMAAQEEADPSCPAASEVGHTIVEAGVGGTLAQAPGKIYLAGPYHGAPISVVAITDAKVGPFDLGTVVVREALRVNPETGEVFVDATGSDPLPHIIDGIPTHLREVRIYMDRPEFVLNPTSCEPTSTASTVLGSGRDFASEADDVPVTVTSRFQAADCAALPFNPRLSIKLIGGTNRGANPALKAHLAMNGIGEAAIAKTVVTLPRSEFLEQGHLNNICTRVQFKEGNGNGEKCPPASVYGYARATTPILSEPLEGPVFLRSSEHHLPDLVAALRGNEITVDLVGRIDSIGGGIRTSFESVPDAPVTEFTLEMAGGQKSLLVNSTSLCAGTHKATVQMEAHNGKVLDSSPKLGVKCSARKHKHKAHKRHRPRRHR